MSTGENQNLATGIARGLAGETVQANSPAVPLAIWPSRATGGLRAAQVMVRPINNAVWIYFDTPIVAGAPGFELAPNLEYVLGIAPQVNTMYLASAQSTTCMVRWILTAG